MTSFQHVIEPPLDLRPDLAVERLIVVRAVDEDEPLGSAERGENAARMVRRGIDVGFAVDEQYGYMNAGRRVRGTYVIDREVALLFGEAEGAIDEVRCEDERRALGRDGS